MCNRDAGHGCGLPKERGLEECRHGSVSGKPEHGADDVEGEMHEGGALGVFGRTDRGEKRGDTGTDILTHDDRDRRAVGNASRDRERLQNTHRGGAGLNDRRQHRAREHAEDRVLEQQEQLGKLGNIGKSLDRARHDVHTEHQGRKAEKDHAEVLLLFAFAEHIKHDAEEREDGGEGHGLEQFQHDVIARNTAKTEDPRGDGGTDVRAHNDVDRLLKRHQSRVDEADDHNGGRGRALNDRGHADTRE